MVIYTDLKMVLYHHETPEVCVVSESAVWITSLCFSSVFLITASETPAVITSSIFTFYTYGLLVFVLSRVQDVLETQLNCYNSECFFIVLSSQRMRFSLSSENIGYIVRVAWGHKIHVCLTQN